MHSHRVVVAFDVFEDSLTGFLLGVEDLVRRQALRLQSRPETLNMGVVVAIAFSRHRAQQSVAMQGLPIAAAGI